MHGQCQRAILRFILGLWGLGMGGLLAAPALAQVTTLPAGTGERPERRLFVPAQELDAVFERMGAGVILPRKQYDELQAAAEKVRLAQPPGAPPTIFTQAEFRGEMQGDQLVLSARWEFNQFLADWQSIPLPFRNLAIESATLDGVPAQLGRAAEQTRPSAEFVLFTRTAGRHVLECKLSAPVLSQGGDKLVSLGLPPVPAATLTLAVPAGKSLQMQQAAYPRPAPLDKPAEYKVPIGGQRQLALRITDKQADRSADSLLFAQHSLGVYASAQELTWHGVSALQIFGRGVDTLEFLVPKSLEVVAVEAAGLERWEIVPNASPQATALKLTFRQLVEESRTVTIRGVATTALGQPWSVPTLSLKQAASQTTRIVVQHAPGLRLQGVEQTGVRRIARAETREASDAGNELLAARWLFASWQPDFSLLFVTQPKERELQTTISTLLDINSRTLGLTSLITLHSRFAPLFELDLLLPAEWTVTDILAAQPESPQHKQAIPWRIVPAEAGKHLVRMTFTPPLAAERKLQLTLQAEMTPSENWPIEAMPLLLKLPEVYLPQAAVTDGTFLIAVEDDLDLLPEEVTGLDPARAATTPGAAGPRLAYQYQDTHFGGRLKVSRKPQRLAARNLAFHRLDRQTLHSHLESRILSEGGGVRKLQLQMPDWIDSNLQFEVLDGAVQIVTQTASDPVGGNRTWTLNFDQRLRGSLVLGLNLTLPRAADKSSFTLPAIAVENADRQESFIAIEGGPDQQLTVSATNAQQQPLAEIALDAVPSPRDYSPQERIVAAYQAVLPGYAVHLQETRFDRLGVPATLCDELQMVSQVGVSGQWQHQATFRLRGSGVQALLVSLPEGGTLWSALLDNTPIEVRAGAKGNEQQFQIPLPRTVVPGASRVLRLVYHSAAPPLATKGTVRQEAPRLQAVGGNGQSHTVEVLKRTWRVLHPRDFQVISHTGNFEPVFTPPRPSLFGDVHFLWRSLGDQWIEKCLALGSVVLVFWLLRAIFRQRRWLAVAGVVVGLVVLAVFTPLYLSHFSNFGLMEGVAVKKEMVRHLPGQRAAGEKSSVELEITGPPDGIGGIGGGFGEESIPPQGAAGTTAPTNMAPVLPTPSAPSSSAPFSHPTDLESSKLSERGREVAQKDHTKDNLGDQQIANAPPAPAPIPAEEPAGRPAGGVPPQKQPLPAIHQPMPPQGHNAYRSSSRLSLSFSLEPAPGEAYSEFRYHGDSGSQPPQLSFCYLQHRPAHQWQLAVECGILGLAFLCRRLTAGRKISLAILGGVLPVALSPTLPPLALPFADGLFLGTMAAVILWSVLALARLCARCCRHRAPAAPSAPITATLLLLMLAGSVQPLRADEEIPPAVKTPPAIFAYEPGESERLILPLEQFRALWQTTHPEEMHDLHAPADGVVSEALYSAALLPAETGAGPRVEITARLVVHSFRSTQVTLALPLESLPLTVATLDGKPAAIVSRKEGAAGDLAIVVGTAGLHILDLKFDLPAERTGLTGRFTLPLKPVAAGLLRFTLPPGDLALRLQAGGVFRQVSEADRKIALIPVAAGGPITVSWSPRQSQETAEGIVHVTGTTALSLTDAGLRLLSAFDYTVRQGTLSTAQFHLPEQLLVREITSLDLAGWEIAGNGTDRTLKVFLRRPVNDRTRITFDLYLPQKFTDETQTISLPPFAPRNITRESGSVGIFAESYLSVSAGTTQGLTQIEPSQFHRGGLPAGDAGPRRSLNAYRSQSLPPLPQLAYHYATRPVTLSLLAARQKARSQGEAAHIVYAGPRKVRELSWLQWNLAGAPRSEVVVQLPPGYLLYDLRAPGVADYFLENRGESKEQPAFLHVILDAPRTGNLSVLLDGIIPRTLDEQSLSLAVPLPVGTSELRSSIGLWLDSVFTGNLQALNGWKSIDPGLLNAWIRRNRGTTAHFAFGSNTPQPQPLALKLGRATPRLRAEAVNVVAVRETAMSYLLQLQWHIDLAGETQFIFTTPETLADRLDFSGNTAVRLRQVTTDKLPGGKLRWTITLEEPRRNGLFLTARATLPPATDGRVLIPRLQFEQLGSKPGEFLPLERQQHYAVLINASAAVLDPLAPAAVQIVPASALPIVQGRQLTDQATEILQLTGNQAEVGWQMRSREQLKSLPATVNLANLKLVLERDGSWRCQADYRINNRARQFLALQLPEEARVLSLFVAQHPARPVHTRRPAGDVLLIPLPKTVAGEMSAEVRLILAGRLRHGLPQRVHWRRKEFELPAPRVLSTAEDSEFGLPTAATEWTVYFPPGLDVQPTDDVERTNVAATVEGYGQALAEATELLQLWDYASRNSAKDVQRSDYDVRAENRARYNGDILFNNLTQLKSKLGSSTVSQDQLRQLDERYANVKRNQKEIQSAQPPVPASTARSLRRSLESLQKEQIDVNGRKFEAQGGDSDSPTADFSKSISELEDLFRVEELSSRDQKPSSSWSSESDKKERYDSTEGKALLNNRAALKAQNSMQSQELAQQYEIRNNTRLEQRAGRQGKRSPPAPQTKPLSPPPNRPGVVAGAAGAAQQAEDAPVNALEEENAAAELQPNDEFLENGVTAPTEATGLSLPLVLEERGEKMTFFKAGGDARLAVSIRPSRFWEFSSGLAWLAVWLLVGIPLSCAVVRQPRPRTVIRRMARGGMALGLIWFWLLPGAWLGFTLFVLSLLVAAAARRKPAVAV